MATIFDIAEEYRAALARREQQALGRLIRQYGDIWKAQKAELARLQADHAARIARGEVPSPAWLYQEQRSRALLAQVEEEVSRWAGDVEAATRELQRIGAMQGQQYVVDTLRAALSRASGIAPGIEGSFMRLSPETINNMIGFLGDGSPLARLFDQVGPDVRAAWEKALLAGLAAGLNPREVARLARRATGMGLDRATRIARTEMLRASRETAHQSMLANPDIYDGWTWLCSLSLRTCASCLAMNGTWHPLTERLEDHVNGRCVAFPSLKPWSSLGVNVPIPTPDAGVPDAEAWLRGLPAADQERILGKRGADLWRKGEIALHEFAERKVSPDWGGMRVQKPLGRILADKQTRWAGLARGDVGGLAGILEHFGFSPNWSGRSKIESSLFQTDVGAFFDSWPMTLPSGRISAGRRDILISPETAADIAARKPEGIIQGLHELLHAASKGFSRGLYNGKIEVYRWVEELSVERVSMHLLDGAMADIGIRVPNALQGAQAISARSGRLEAFVNWLKTAGLTDSQVGTIMEIGMRAPLKSRRLRWVYEIADRLGVSAAQADRIVRKAIQEAKNAP